MKPRWECYGPFAICFRDMHGDEITEAISFFHSISDAQQWARETMKTIPRAVQFDARCVEVTSF